MSAAPPTRNRIRSGQCEGAPGKLWDVDFTEQGVRTGLERCLRTSAHEADQMGNRTGSVHQSNTLSPRTTR
ncbi:tetratricopeptide repeat protein [Nocardia halotolerans]|uniref:Tetratricopeptide repeat protein n=1 Tax=Nocardia halotolerans TaxID=1755878 RepID=A0ABV8VLV9_9NOCA